jgi:hypothetical protein
MAGIGDYKKGKAFELRSGKAPAFKMLGSSPMKQVNIQTGFGPEADANLKNKVNPKKVAKVAKKGIWQGTKKVGKFLFSKVAVPAMALYNSPKLLEKDGVKKFAGSMIWDEHLFLPGNRPVGTTTKYNPSEETTPKSKKVEGLYDKKSLKGI